MSEFPQYYLVEDEEIRQVEVDEFRREAGACGPNISHFALIGKNMRGFIANNPEELLDMTRFQKEWSQGIETTRKRLQNAAK